jgi:hypothetical protein
MDEQERRAIGQAVARIGDLAAEGDLAAAARAFGGFISHDEEAAVLEDAGCFEAPNLLRVFHAAPLTHAGALAEALTEFLSPTQQGD